MVLRGGVVRRRAVRAGRATFSDIFFAPFLTSSLPLACVFVVLLVLSSFW